MGSGFARYGPPTRVLLGVVRNQLKDWLEPADKLHSLNDLPCPTIDARGHACYTRGER